MREGHIIVSLFGPNLSTRYIFGMAEKGVRKGRVSVVDAGDHRGVLFTDQSISSLLPLTSDVEVVVGELVTVKALMNTTV